MTAVMAGMVSGGGHVASAFASPGCCCLICKKRGKSKKKFDCKRRCGCLGGNAVS